MSRTIAWFIIFMIAAFSVDTFSMESDKTCVYLPRLVSDAAEWELDDQERGEVDSVLGEALELCADGKEKEAQELIETTSNERIMDWRRGGRKKQAGQEQN